MHVYFLHLMNISVHWKLSKMFYKAKFMLRRESFLNYFIIIIIKKQTRSHLIVV